MARTDAGTMFRSSPTDYKLGDYNGITKVLSSTTVDFTGSNAGAGFIVENTTNVVVHAAGGGTLPTAALNTKTLYPIGVKKVVIGGTGVVYVLHK
jgi:hypothetical protein